MATIIQKDDSGTTPWLAFLVGGLLVAIAAFAFFAYTGGKLSAPSEPSKIEFNVKPPATNPAE